VCGSSNQENGVKRVQDGDRRVDKARVQRRYDVRGSRSRRRWRWRRGFGRYRHSRRTAAAQAAPAADTQTERADKSATTAGTVLFETRQPASQILDTAS